MMNRLFKKIRFNYLIDHWNRLSLIKKCFILLLIFIFLFYYFCNLVLYLLKLCISLFIFNVIFNNIMISNYFIRLIVKYIIIYIVYLFCSYLFPFIDILNIMNFLGDGEDSGNEKNDNDNLNEKKSTKKNSNALTASITAGGLVGSTVMKNLPAGMPVGQKVGITVATAGATSFTTYVGASAGEYISDNIIKKETIIEYKQKAEETVKEHPYSDPDPDRVPSPDTTINSPLEDGDYVIPLMGLLGNISLLNICALFVLIIIINIIFNKYISAFYIKLIKYIVNKYIPIKLNIKINKYLDKGANLNNKFMEIMLFINIILLLIIILGNLFLSNHLYENIDDYVLVYNEYKKINKNSILLLLVYNNNNLKIKNRFNLLNTNKKYSSKFINLIKKKRSY